MEVEINFLAVFLAMASSMVVGSIWYAKGVFGASWAKLAKVDLDKKTGKDMTKPMISTIIVSLVTAYVLAHFSYISARFFTMDFLDAALTTALWAWLGFTAARFITHDAFEGRPNKLTLMNIGNEFVTIMIMGLIIGLFGV